MKLNSKLTGGLAWAGLVVVLAVPSADMLLGKGGDAAKEPATGTEAIRTAVVTPVASDKPAVAAPVVTPVKVPAIQTAAKGADPVDTFVQSGKKMPSYISDAPANAAAEQPQAKPQLGAPGVPSSTKPPVLTTATPTVEVATREMHPELVAPIPYPASKRPRTPLTTTVATVTPSTSTVPVLKPVEPTTTVVTPTTPVVGPRAPAVASTEQPLILDENTVERRDEAVARVLDEDVQVTRVQPRVDEDQLEEWDSGSLAEYLERKGLMSNQAQASNADVDPDGFYLDEGPNNDRSDARVVRRVKPRNDFFFF
jgi:hypothetical protein